MNLLQLDLSCQLGVANLICHFILVTLVILFASLICIFDFVMLTDHFANLICHSSVLPFDQFANSYWRLSVIIGVTVCHGRSGCMFGLNIGLHADLLHAL
jgi:hypothetical protein